MHDTARNREVIRRRRSTVGVLSVALLAGTAMVAEAATLTPTRSQLLRQVSAAREHNLTYAQNEAQVHQMVRSGELVRLRGNAHYQIASFVRWPYAHPSAKLFIERLGKQYHEATGEKLVVTSMVRPRSKQPRNSSKLSVHPTGIAIDLRVSSRRASVQWLSSVLLQLEGRGVLDAAREHRPPHFHLAVFPSQYTNYVAKLEGRSTGSSSATRTAQSAARSTYKVRSGDNLWVISRRFNTTVRDIQSANGLRGSSLRPGQVLTIP